MGVQINKGTTYADGDSVTFTNLNNHVDNATLAVGSITSQASATSIGSTDKILIAQGTELKQGTISQLQVAVGTGNFVKTDGTVPMATNAQLTLGSTSQIADLNAVSLKHLNTNFIKNLGPQTFNGLLNIGGTGASGIKLLTSAQTLTLSKNPTGSLEAATKQYVDATSVQGKAVFSGRFVDIQSTWPGTYSASASLATFTFTGENPFSVGHKFSAICTLSSGSSAPLRTNVFTVTDVNGNSVTVTALNALNTNASIGAFTIPKCLIHGSSGVFHSIIYAGASNDACYLVNLTSELDVDLMTPIVSLSRTTGSATANYAGGNGYVVLYDELAFASTNKQITRETSLGSGLTNSFIFTSYVSGGSSPGTADAGYRSSVAIL